MSSSIADTERSLVAAMRLQSRMDSEAELKLIEDKHLFENYHVTLLQLFSATSQPRQPRSLSQQPAAFPALYLCHLNADSLVKHINLTNNQHVKIGRRMNAHTAPAENNGHMVVHWHTYKTYHSIQANHTWGVSLWHASAMLDAQKKFQRFCCMYWILSKHWSPVHSPLSSLSSA